MGELIPDCVTPTFEITRPKWIIFSYAQKKKKKKNAVNRNQLQNDLGDVISSDTEPVSRLLKKNW